MLLGLPKPALPGCPKGTSFSDDLEVVSRLPDVCMDAYAPEDAARIGSDMAGVIRNIQVR